MGKIVKLNCANCGIMNEVPLKNRMKGSFPIELVLWLFFIIPGIIYTIWRYTSKETVAICPNCGKSVVW